MTQVFISYSRKDLEFVDRLANDLKATGFEVWYDLSGLEPGSRWRQEIQKAIQDSQFFLVVLSPNSIISDWVEREFLFASDQDKKIIPLLYQPCTLPMWSLNLHFIDMQGKNYSLHYQDLLKVMGVRTGSEEENPIAIRYIEIGDEYRKRGKTAQSIESYQQALNVDPGNLKAHINIAAVHLSEQAYAEAAASYELALQISNSDLVARAGWSDANMALGNQARAEGKLDEAIRFYLEILRVVPDDGDARKSLANIFTSRADKALASGQVDEALATFSDAIKYTPDDLDLVSNLEKLQAQRKTSQVDELVARSETEITAGKWEQALAALQEALQISPQDAFLLKKIANIQTKQQQHQLDAILSKVDQAEQAQRWDAALAGLQDYLNLKPDDKVIQKRMADLMQSKHAAWLTAVTLRVDQALADRNWDDALGALNDALQLEPDNKALKTKADQIKKDQGSAILNATIMRADQAAAAGRWDDSIGILNNGLVSYPDNAALKDKLAETLQARRKLQLQSVLDQTDMSARAGNWESALTSLNRVLADEPDNAVFLEKYNHILKLERDSKVNALRTRAKSLLKEQKFEEALATCNEALLFAPENRQAILAEIEAVNNAQKLETSYSEGVKAFEAKDHQAAVDMLSYVQQEQPGYKDAAKLLAKTRKLLSSAQKTTRTVSKKAWVIGITLTLLALGISALIFWSLNKGLPVVPAVIATNTTTSITTTLPSSSPTPQTKTITVTSAEDDGPGSLRQAMLDARAGDTITFDPATFPADDPIPINLYSALPIIDQGYLTLDASNAGVVLNGSHVGGEWTAGIDIWSDHNIIEGLGIIGFSGPGIALQTNANFNIIGGDRDVGLSQIGEGNFVGANSDGMAIWGSDNVITGNLVGILSADSEDLEVGNKASGIFIADLASHNTIGPDNIIAYNGKIGGGGGSCGIDYISLDAKDNNLTANIIFENEPASPAICYNINPGGRFVYSTPPTILYFDLESGTAAGQTCPNCLVEIFSTSTRDARIFEGTVTADEYGNFVFRKSGELSGLFLTATSRSPGENTSEISLPTPQRTDLMIALDKVWVSAPYFETSFNSSSLVYSRGDVKFEDGKLILSSYDPDGASVTLADLLSSNLAVEFELNILDSHPDSVCVMEILNDQTAAQSKRAMSAEFWQDGMAILSRNVTALNGHERVAANDFDVTQTNVIKLINLGYQFAAFINGQVAYVSQDPGGRADYTHLQLSAYNSAVCEFDNYKLWDLSGVNFNP